MAVITITKENFDPAERISLAVETDSSKNVIKIISEKIWDFSLQ